MPINIVFIYKYIAVHHRNPNTKKQMILLTHLYAVVAPTTIVGLPGESQNGEDRNGEERNCGAKHGEREQGTGDNNCNDNGNDNHHCHF
jgi:hypothetical protein